MALAEDLTILENELKELIKRYEQYFIGLEKREPLQLLSAVERLVRRYSNVPITNTMYKHQYSALVARFNTYREHWNHTLRLIEEGKYSRDRFISNLHQHQRNKGIVKQGEPSKSSSLDPELDRIFIELREARKACNLPVDNLSIEQVAVTIEKSKAVLAARLGTSNLVFRVVVEDGKPRIKASQRK
jgi:replicative superfamily II helicase